MNLKENLLAGSRVLPSEPLRWIRLLLTIAFTPLFSGSSLSQETTRCLRGKVVDRNTDVPLQAASIYIRGKSIGTISNNAGEFNLRVPSMYKNDTVTISYLGYETFSELLYKVKAGIFSLEPSGILLPAVQVNAPENIVRQAFENIDKNYPVTPYILKAFYRDWKVSETIDPDSVAISLLEAAVSIYDAGYDKANNRSSKERVFLDEIRRNESPGTIYNYFDLLLEKNLVRHHRSKNISSHASDLPILLH